ncbi:putative secreted protein with PEP-CTERM sorting signal [Pseudoduganella flava]|uniref:PEP-CTERM sorting domain-containing protein n=1 Tax=Pseudoduganella flava TaxID=871742 RepID=A0A562PKP4_9BURK|nr:PEP-CTERM sorting domain-containing protein [Pseudoduganella flava]QGZ42388.1 PEP-CTERM sorting domain-containing protein [Pseudoduganella flava]TWI44948.1 putative secreted protein with PEP-CTERM sorting signal [Pseudoduganella flava]
MGNVLDRCARAARLLLAAIAVALAGFGSAGAAIISYDFDTFADSTALTDQYAGLHFTHATVLRAGVSLNEVSFPPRSGEGVVFDDGGGIVITFDTLASTVAGYFTYFTDIGGITLSAYDSADNLLAVVTSTHTVNTADGSGDPGSVPNELLSVTAPGDLIARIVVRGMPDGGSLVLDDLSVTTAAVAVPEPGTLPLVLGALALALLVRGRRSGNRHA